MDPIRSWLCPVVLFFLGAPPAPSAAVAAGEPTTLRALYRLPRTEAIDPAHTALVLVDFQEEFVSGKLPILTAPAAVERARVLLDWARAAGVHVVHVQNVTRPGSLLFAPDSPTIAFLAPLRPRTGEVVVVKHLAGAFSRTDLDQRLRALGVHRVVLAGIMTHLAVDTSARDAAVLGYEVIVAADATATRSLPGVLGGPSIDAATVKLVALASLADRFAEVLDVEQIRALRLR
jgi:nicotinamidase-related amidase